MDDGRMTAELQLELWESLREALRRRFGEASFGRWMAGLSLLSVDGETIRVGVPNHFVMDWIRTRYLGEFESLLKEQTGREFHVQLAIDPRLFRECRLRRDEVMGELAAGTTTEPARQANEERGGAPVTGWRAEPEASELTLDSFVRGASNELALSVSLDVVGKPGHLYNPLLVFGGSGVGKTHLLRGLFRAFRERERTKRRHTARRIRYVSAEQFSNHFVASIQDGSVRRFRERYRSLDVLLIDDVHLLVNRKKTQLELLYTFNALVESGRQVVLSSNTAPQDLQDLLPALVGRFLSGLVAKLQKPDYETRLHIARSHARRLRSRLRDDVLQFVAEHFRGSPREIVGAVMQLDVHSRLRSERLRVPDAHDILAESLKERDRRVTLRRIHEAVAAHYNLDVDSLVSPSRQRYVASARQVAMYLARRYLRVSLAEIGKYFGNRRHATVRCAEVKIGKLLAAERSAVAQDINAIVESLEG